MKECGHLFQHVVGKDRVQYCVDCKEVLYGSGRNGKVLEKDQKTASQHKCFTKKQYVETAIKLDNHSISYDFNKKNS